MRHCTDTIVDRMYGHATKSCKKQPMQSTTEGTIEKWCRRWIHCQSSLRCRACEHRRLRRRLRKCTMLHKDMDQGLFFYREHALHPWITNKQTKLNNNKTNHQIRKNDREDCHGTTLQVFQHTPFVRQPPSVSVSLSIAFRPLTATLQRYYTRCRANRIPARAMLEV